MEIWILGVAPRSGFCQTHFFGFLKMSIFSGSKIPLLAIHKIISHIWEDRSRKVNNDEPDLRFFHGNFWPVISRTVRKPCFSAWIPRGPNFWKPLTCGYVAAGAFFSRKMDPHIFGAPTMFLEALNGWLRCRRHFFLSEKCPHIFGSPTIFLKNGPSFFGSP